MSEVLIKIKLKASFGGQFTGSAINLIEKSLAEAVIEEPPKLVPKIFKGKKSGK